MFSKIVGRKFQNNDSQVFVSNQYLTLDPKEASKVSQNNVKAKLLIKIKQVLNFRTKTLKAISMWDDNKASRVIHF